MAKNTGTWEEYVELSPKTDILTKQVEELKKERDATYFDMKKYAEENFSLKKRVKQLKESLDATTCDSDHQRKKREEALKRVEHLEHAWLVDEQIQADGSLRPSIYNTVKRAEKAETDLAALKEAVKDALSYNLPYLAEKRLKEASEQVKRTPNKKEEK